MEIVQRILNKVVGQEISAAELELVSGALIDRCVALGGYGTAGPGEDPDFPDPYRPCDFD